MRIPNRSYLVDTAEIARVLTREIKRTLQRTKPGLFRFQRAISYLSECGYSPVYQSESVALPADREKYLPVLELRLLDPDPVDLD